MKAVLKRGLAGGARRRALVVLPVLALLSAGVTFAAFSSGSSNTGNSVAAAPDYAAPTVSAHTVSKQAGGVGGYVAQNSQIYVYANVTDTGNPASGIAPPVNIVATLPGYGPVTIPLTAGSFSAGGVSYNYRSAVQTMPPMAEGPVSYTIDTADNAGNNGSTPGSFVVDNTAPAASDVQTTNKLLGVPGVAETGDTLVYTFSEPPEPESILAGWTGGSQAVTLRLNNAGGANGDNVTIFNQANNTQLNLGTVHLRRTDYVTTNRTFTNSTMTLSGSTLTVVLGTPSGLVGAALGNASARWAPSAAATDRAGNAMDTTTITETGGADREF